MPLVPPTESAPYLQKPLALIDTTFNLYGFLPEDDDPRWAFLARYEAAKRQAPFSAMNFANAWGATYLSSVVSYRNGFINSPSTENELQLNRALDNLSHADTVAELYDATADGFAAFDMRLAKTDRLTTDPTKPVQAVTPCPEALYQVQLYADDYLARVGFNIHVEDATTVLSIANIQGTPGSVSRNAAFEATYGTTPFNALVARVVALAVTQDTPYVVRGMINPERGNPRLYWCALSHESVSLWHAQRKVSQPNE